MSRSQLTQALTAFVRKLLLAWVKVFSWLVLLSIVVALFEGGEALVEGHIVWGEVPLFLWRVAPELIQLAFVASLLLIVSILVVVGPIVWFSDRKREQKQSEYSQ